MKTILWLSAMTLVMAVPLSPSLKAQQPASDKDYNSWYTGKHLDRVAFPLGGMGAGMVCLEGSGALSHLSVSNQPDVFNEPFAFAALTVKGMKNGAKVLQGELPSWKVFGQPNSGNGGGEHYYGLPRFDSARFLARFPFASIELTDSDIPMEVTVTGWSPFTPGNADDSSLPAGILEYNFRNLSDRELESVFSWNSKNIIRKDGQSKIGEAEKGFTLFQPGSEKNPENLGWFRVTCGEENTVVDHCWFRGGWFDALTILWKNISEGRVVENEAHGMDAPGASLYVPFSLLPGQEKTIRIMLTWYSPETRLQIGGAPPASGDAFGAKPSSGTAPGQQEVTGYLGKQLINTYDPAGDGMTGLLTSPEFTIRHPYIQFLSGGGSHKGKTAVQLLVNGQVVRESTGDNSELLRMQTWEVRDWMRKKAKIRVVDLETGAWGHINLDHILFSRNPLEDLSKPGPGDVLFEDFEGSDYGGWFKEPAGTVNGSAEGDTCCEGAPWYKPWYAARFKSIDEVTDYITVNYARLRSESERFRDAFYASTLPDEVIEAVAANLTILKSPTILRTEDGKLWAWEGCSDGKGCCHGSCTHVWNYAQAIPHLFPELERSLRETEFLVSQDESGHQAFRANLPVTEPGHGFHAAADGQLGGIMKAYRDWRISGDRDWMLKLFPRVRASMDYCIATWDPDHLGVLVEPHHNTYDIEFWGPDGMCSSFYLGALTAMVEMCREAGQSAELYITLLEKGIRYMEEELFDGEYFIQKIQWTGLRAPDPTRVTVGYGIGYSPEALQILQEEGPKYQYGQGCLSDGVLGMWLATASGLPEVLDDGKVTSHLVAVHRYNLKHDLRDHPNPQRPTFAVGREGGLLLCTWPKGGALSLPFVYSNEVWTGIEYQVASHLLMKGETEKGLSIVRACRDRYDGSIRNPFNEYECGHWYARALSSYALIQGMSGVRFDAVSGILHINDRMGEDFKVFLSTAGGYGLAGLKKGEPFVEVVSGEIPVKEFALIREKR